MTDLPRTFESDVEEARVWLRATFASWAAALTRAEHAAVADYKGDSYLAVNGDLRTGTESAEAPLVRDLDSALRKFRLTEAVVVWRAFESPTLRDAIDAGDDLTGARVTDPAYVSTSLLRPIATHFLQLTFPDDALLARIVVAAGTHVGAHVGAPDLVLDLDEFEILLPRETTLEVRSVDPPDPASDDVPTIHFEVTP